MGRIILLTEPECVEAVSPRLALGGAAVTPVFTLAQLERALAGDLAETRLLSFGAGVIVPERLLKKLPGPAYNLHPGPPDYPGLFPSVYALYDRAETFGVTLHEMAPVVDSGPIVAVDTFPIAPDSNRLSLDTQTFQVMLDMIAHLAPALATTTWHFPRSDLTWTGARRTRRDFEALCRLPEGAGIGEFARRLRAVGEGPNHAIIMTRFGREFRLLSEDTPVVRGGQRV